MEKISFFSADFRDGRIRIGSKTYPAGTFATHLLNQYFKDDTAARISAYVMNNWAVQKSLTKGYLNARMLNKTGDDILEILKALPKLKPFNQFDIESERQLISETVPSTKKQTKNLREKPNEKNDKYYIKLLCPTAFIPRFA